MPVACLALLAVASLLGSVGCNSDQSKPSGAAAGQTGASTTDPKTIARQGWWRGWFDDALNDFFRFRVEDDEIHDTYFTAAKSDSMCGISVIVSGVQLDDHIVDHRFDYSMRALRFTGEFVDSKHAQITFTDVDDACAVREGGQYDAYWVEDPCGPDIAQIVDLTGGNAGARRVFSVHAEPLVPKACDDGVPDGTEVTLTLEDPDGTGSSLEQVSVRLEDGTATAALLLGESSGTCRVEASVEGIAPSNRSDPITVRGTTGSGTGGAGGAPTTGGSAGTSGEQARGGVLLVVDKSDSMASAASGSPTANWGIVLQAVSSVVDSAGPMTRFGLELFPGSEVTPRCNEAACCAMPAPGSMTVPIPASGVTGLAIADALSATTPGGWSPLGDALESAYSYLTQGTDVAEGTALWLVTVGAPNCNPELACGPEECIPNLEEICTTANCCESDAGQLQCRDDARVLTAVTRLAEAGVHTRVFALPGSEGDQEQLGEVAAVGGGSLYVVSAAEGAEGLKHALEQAWLDEESP